MGTKNQKPKFKTIKLSLEEDNPIVGVPNTVEPTRKPVPTRTHPAHRRHAPAATQATKGGAKKEMIITVPLASWQLTWISQEPLPVFNTGNMILTTIGFHNILNHFIKGFAVKFIRQYFHLNFSLFS